MPIQAPQWTDYLNCPACCREFTPTRSPISLVCGHTLCRQCINNLHRKQCPFDQTDISVHFEELVTNTALLQLAGYPSPPQPYHPPCVLALNEADRLSYDVIVKCMEQLAVFLKYCGSASAVGSRLSRPMQRKLVTLLQCTMTDNDGRGKAARAARSLGERTVTELILQHQNPQQLSANLWAAVRSRGCQFLGPAMQEEVLKLVLLALEDGSALSRKVLVMFVVQRLEPHFPQASKTSIGHVVQLLYRASCFKVSKRERDSSLMQLKEEFRTYETLRREHDAQIVQIATESGLRIAPDQWSALLYGDTQHKSHMQSIIDKLQTPQSFSQSVQELFIALQRSGDPAQLIVMSLPLDRLASIDASPDAESPTWQQLGEIMTALKDVVAGLVNYMHIQNGRDATMQIMERLAESPGQGMLQGSPMPGRYKVAMCRDAQARTYCPRGNNCTYAHSEEELERYRNMNFNCVVPVNVPPAITIARPVYQRYGMPPQLVIPMLPQHEPTPRRPDMGADAEIDVNSYQPIPMPTREQAIVEPLQYNVREPNQRDVCETHQHDDRDLHQHDDCEQDQHDDREPVQHDDHEPDQHDDHESDQHDDNESHVHDDREAQQHDDRELLQYDVRERIQYDVRESVQFDLCEPQQFDDRERLQYGAREATQYDFREPHQYGDREPQQYDNREQLQYVDCEPQQYVEREPLLYNDREPLQYDAREPLQYDAREPPQFDTREPLLYNAREPFLFDAREPNLYNNREQLQYNDRELLQYNDCEPLQYDAGEPLQYDEREPKHAYGIMQPTFEHPPPNIAADNYTTSYAGGLMHGEGMIAAAVNQFPPHVHPVSEARHFPQLPADHPFFYTRKVAREMEANRMNFTKGIVTGQVEPPSPDDFANQAFNEDHPATVYLDNELSGENCPFAQPLAQEPVWPANNPNGMYQMVHGNGQHLSQPNVDVSVVSVICDMNHLRIGNVNDARAEVAEPVQVGPYEQVLEIELQALEERISSELSHDNDELANDKKE